MVKNFKSTDSRYYDTDGIPLTLSGDRSGFLCWIGFFSSDHSDRWRASQPGSRDRASIPKYSDHWTDPTALCGVVGLSLQLPHSQLQ